MGKQLAVVGGNGSPNDKGNREGSLTVAGPGGMAQRREILTGGKIHAKGGKWRWERLKQPKKVTALQHQGEKGGQRR